MEQKDGERLTAAADHADDERRGGGRALDEHGDEDADHQAGHGVVQDRIVLEDTTRLLACK